MDQAQSTLFEVPACPGDPSPGTLAAHVRNGVKFREPLNFSLFPELPGSSLPEGHLVRQIARIIASLDLGWLRRLYAHRGGVPYLPEQMLAVVLYGMTCGMRTGSDLQESCRYDDRFKFLMGGHKPDDRTFERFIDRVGPCAEELLKSVLELARGHGMAKAGEVAIDGCKLAGSSSWWKHTQNSGTAPSDPDARLMNSHGRKMVGYNALTAVDTRDGLIVGAALVNDQNDWNAGPVIVEAVRSQLGEYPAVVIADSGFESPDGICGVENLGVDTVFAVRDNGLPECLSQDHEGRLTCPAGKIFVKRPKPHKMADGRICDTYRPEGGCRGCPLKDQCAFFKKKLEVPEGADPVARFRNRDRVQSAAYHGAMKRRQRVETPNAFLKRHDRFERLRGRNLGRAAGELYLWVASYNLRKILRLNLRALLRFIDRFAAHLGQTSLKNPRRFGRGMLLQRRGLRFTSQ
jgi:transposase